MPNPARRTIALAALAVAIIAAAVALDLASVAAQSEEQTGRIVAQRLDDGRTEFGWQPAGGARVLPSARYFPADAQVDRWLNSSPVEVDGAEIGRINARLRSDGRIEFAFTPTDGERIEPSARYFPVDARVGRWLRSTTITISAASATGFVAVAAGNDHNCAIRAGSGAIECWGDNYAGQLDAPAGRFSAVSAGADYTCAIRESREIECWGAKNSPWGLVNDFGQLAPPPGPFTAVSSGKEHACGLRPSGAIECWGTPVNDHGQTAIPPGRFTAVSAGFTDTCAIRASGEIECWGLAEFVLSAAPDDPYISVIAYDFCGLRESGETDCPQGGSPPLGPFTAVSVSFGGGRHACAIRAGSGAIECWGSNSRQLGEYNEDTGEWTLIEEIHTGALDAPPGRFTAVAAGGYHGCAIRAGSGAIECWGWSEYGATDPPAP